jgi:hypothetical protein
MQFLNGIILKQLESLLVSGDLIKWLEQFIVAHEPDAQALIMKELEALADKLKDWIVAKA